MIFGLVGGNFSKFFSYQPAYPAGDAGHEKGAAL